MNEDKASRYHRLKRRGAVLSTVATAALLAALLLTGAAAALRDLAMALTGAAAGSVSTVIVFSLLLAAAQEAVAFPFVFHSSFLLERRYGLSSESFGTWVADHAKAVGLGALLGLAGAVVVYLSIRTAPDWWWLASAVAFMTAIAGLSRLAPTLLLPLFYKFTPLSRESLRERLVALSRRAGVPVLGVYEWGLGEKTRRANAALVGSGTTRRIIISDTLLAEYSDDEIEVILAHELAHHVHKDIPKSLVMEFVFLVLAFAAAAAALSASWQPLGLQGPDDAAGLPLLMLAGGAVFVCLSPLGNAVSRWNERRADRYALDLTRQPAAFMSAMRRLAAQNLAEAHPSRATLWLFHTHPPIEQRIETARTARFTSTEGQGGDQQPD